MDIRSSAGTGNWRNAVKALFFSAMFLLPWINQARLSIFLFFITAILILISRQGKFNINDYKSNVFVWLFGIYYLFQVIAFCIYPHDLYTSGDLERKASLIVIPLLLYLLLEYDKESWSTGIRGFIWGIIAASAWCLLMAVTRYAYSHDLNEFFYHQYSGPIHLNAIYFSVFIVVAMGYLLLNNIFKGIRLSNRVNFLVILFLLLNLLLLSSKMIIAAGLILFMGFLVFTNKSKMQRAMIIGMICIVCLLLVVTKNPLKTRFSELGLNNYEAMMRQRDFKDFQFNGLNLRLVLWILGTELVNENKEWLFGAGGERYHPAMNAKIAEYGLYSGNPELGDQGYKNYNMHNQYMESYLQFGIAGLSIILAILSAGFYQAIKSGNRALIYVLIIFSLSFLSESLFETQAGLLLFTIIISGEWIHSQMKIHPRLTSH